MIYFEFIILTSPGVKEARAAAEPRVADPPGCTLDSNDSVVVRTAGRARGTAENTRPGPPSQCFHVLICHTTECQQ